MNKMVLVFCIMYNQIMIEYEWNKDVVFAYVCVGIDSILRRH